MSNESMERKKSHSLILKDRSSLSMTGVVDVDSFNDQNVIAYTDMGELTVTGTDLHISKVNLDSGDLSLEGNISGLIYSDKKKETGIFAKLYK